MDARRASLPLKILYAVVAAMLLWAIIGSAMGHGVVSYDTTLIGTAPRGNS
jgi:hypothetical protein